MAYEKLEQHRILPRALYDSYASGYTDGSHINVHKLTANEYPDLLTEEFQFYSQSPHQLAEWMLKNGTRRVLITLNEIMNNQLL